MLGLNETQEQLYMANSVRKHAYVLSRRWSRLQKGIIILLAGNRGNEG